MRQRLHLFKHIQLNLFAPRLEHAGETVAAKADVDARSQKPPERKIRMAEIMMAPRTVNNVNLVFCEQQGVALGEVVNVHGEKIFTQHTATRQMLDRGA